MKIIYIILRYVLETPVQQESSLPKVSYRSAQNRPKTAHVGPQICTSSWDTQVVEDALTGQEMKDEKSRRERVELAAHSLHAMHTKQVYYVCAENTR